jgi:hypothetical protein
MENKMIKKKRKKKEKIRVCERGKQEGRNVKRKERKKLNK